MPIELVAIDRHWLDKGADLFLVIQGDRLHEPIELLEPDVVAQLLLQLVHRFTG